MKQFKIRASSANSIMAEPRLKSELISQGCKTYCENWLVENLFNRYEIIRSKYIDKGNSTEEESLNLMVKALKMPMIYKNTERREDEYKTGEPDIITKDYIIDNKSSYSLKTFPIFSNKLNQDYYAQMQVYMNLFDLPKAKVIFTLNNTPIDILSKELRWISDDDEKQRVAINHVFTEKYWKEVKDSLFPNASKIQFTSIEDVKRVKVFEVDRNDEYVNNMHIKVKLCRDYIKTLLDGSI